MMGTEHFETFTNDMDVVQKDVCVDNTRNDKVFKIIREKWNSRCTILKFRKLVTNYKFSNVEENAANFWDKRVLNKLSDFETPTCMNTQRMS